MPRSTALAQAKEELCVLCRRRSRLLLDDCPYRPRKQSFRAGRRFIGPLPPTHSCIANWRDVGSNRGGSPPQCSRTPGEIAGSEERAGMFPELFVRG